MAYIMELAKALKQEDPETRVRILKALMELKDPRATPALLEALDDCCLDVRRAKEWLLLGCLRLRGLEQVTIHAALSFTAMLAVAHAAVRCCEPGLMRSIKHFTA